MSDETFPDRILRIANEVTLADNFMLRVDRDQKDPEGRWFYQIECLRKDVITGEEGWGRGNKYYLSEHASESELVRLIFGAYLAYWEHEARETFQYKTLRVFGPHISVEALMTVARKVDVRSARHEEDS